MAFVFPRIKPLGTSSEGSRKSIGRKSSYPTESMDYLKIDIFDSKKNNPYNYVGANAGTGRSAGVSKDSIFLYLPGNLSEVYTTRYNQQTALGAAGVAGIGAAAAGTLNGVGNTISDAATQIKTNLAAQIAAEAVNISNLGNTNLSANDFAALTKKAIMNPYEETTFQGTDYRNHSFDFKLVPKGMEDVGIITQIIQKLRTSMLPGKNSSSGLDASTNDIFSQIESGGSGRGDRWLTIPDFFHLSIVRYKGSAERINESMSRPETLGFIMQFPTKCVLSSMNVNLTPDGQLSTLRNGATGDNDQTDYGPNAYNLSLTFNETAFLTKDMFQG